ncbi:MAG: alpha/beta hydrolase [Chitinophagaceae bacterium]|nr:MAG: alpha/beta hydrolase [Chitinophagaceae bacterium]
MKILLLSLLALNLGVSSCSKDVGENSGDTPATTKLNVAYGADPLQKADIYLPAARSATSTKVMLMIHGGGWSVGDKNEFNAFVDTMKRRLPNYAVININYRLASGSSNLFPTQENDVKTALEFINANRQEFQISDKFVLLGASAGAHLAMLQAYKYSAPAKVKAVVDFFGPADMTAMYNDPAPLAPSSSIAGVMGGTPTSKPGLYFSSSPINFIDAQSPATIIFQGGLDPLVKASQSIAVKDKLTAAGVPNQYVFYPTGGHGDWNAATFTDAFNKIEAFLQTNVP